MSGIITISHTAEEGTLVHGDPRPHHGELKSRGFRWSRNIDGGAWYIPNSRDRLPQVGKINAAAEALRAAGLTVEVAINAELRPFAEAEADRVERLGDRQDALSAKAERLGERAEATLAQASQMADAIPFGQPILVGHYSERRDRNYRDRIWNTMGRGVELSKEAEETERRAVASEANLRHRESVGTTLRRIEREEAEVRRIERRLAGKPCPMSDKSFKEDAEVTIGETRTCKLCSREYIVTDERKVGVHYMYPDDGPPTGRYLERLTTELARLTEEIAYWKAHVAEREASGVKVWSKDDFKKGDFVKYWGGWREVVRVNAKSVSVKTQYSWTDTVPYDKVLGQRAGGLS